MTFRYLLYPCLFLLPLSAADLIVGSGGNFTTIQAALDVAVAGDQILVESGTYNEQLVFPNSGDETNGPITLRAANGQQPILDGTGFSSGHMVLIQDKSHLVIDGFEIRNLTGVQDGSGVRIQGQGTNLQILNCRIHHILGQDAMGITVYGTSSTPISNLIIRNNEIYDCEPAQSEALTLNGNVTDFQVLDNTVRDVNNIGIDFIGGETDINPDPSLVARNGICRGNFVQRARSNYGGGYGAGIYVDGGRDIVIEFNTVTECDLGIEIGAENPGQVTENVIVRGNIVYRNDKVGIVFGGYQSSVGRVRNSYFLNNVCYDNDTLGEGLGELWIQYADTNFISGNIFFAGTQNILTYSEGGNRNNQLNYNLWYSQGDGASAEFVWQGTFYGGFSAFQSGTGQATNGLWDDPDLVNPAGADFHLRDGSPAIDRGDPSPIMQVGPLDFDGEARIANGRIDIGADEVPGINACLIATAAQWRGSAASPCPGDNRTDIRDLIAIVNETCSCGPS